MLGLVCAGGFASATATDLLQVYDRSTVTDPLIQQATAQHLAVRENRTQALLGLLPIDFSANKYWQNVGSVPVTTPATASLSLAVNLFSWNSWIALKSADATVAQGEANFLAAQQSLVQRVAAQYFAVLAAQDTLAAQQSALQSVQIQLDQAEQRFNVGLVAITDVEIARASRDSTNAAVIAAKRTLATQQDLLRAITGESYTSLAGPGDDMPLLTPEPASEDAWVTTAMEQNASLIASRMAAEIARDSLLSAYGGHIPTVGINVYRNWALEHGTFTPPLETGTLLGPLAPATGNTDTIWQIGVSVPIFTAGATQSKVRQAHYTWDAAKAGLDYTSRQTEEQTRDAYQGVISQISQVQALKQAVQSSRVSLQASEAGYAVGIKTAVDVLTSRELLVQAETNYAQAKYGYLDNIVSLRLAAGSLDRHTVELINGWLDKLETPELHPVKPPDLDSVPQPNPSALQPLPDNTPRP
ncbi:MAG TPA: TolC family outer membrane protein [Steroidobacteraceae bacterium]|nr:TolC family outer membrane protein [Steroidobacteraceae bacterium]